MSLQDFACNIWPFDLMAPLIAKVSCRANKIMKKCRQNKGRRQTTWELLRYRSLKSEPFDSMMMILNMSRANKTTKMLSSQKREGGDKHGNIQDDAMKFFDNFIIVSWNFELNLRCAT